MAMQEKSLIEFFKTRMKRRDQRRWGCQDDAQIAAYADHQLAGPAKIKLEAHLADCDFCLDQVGFLIRSANAPLPESVPDPLLLRARKLAGEKARAEGIALWHWGKIAAATACLVVVGTIAIRNRPAGPLIGPATHPIISPTPVQPQVAPPTPKVTTPLPAVRGGHKNFPEPTLVFPTDRATVSGNNIEFRWEPVAGTLDYEVKLLTAEGDSVWTQTTMGSSLRLSPDVKLEAGKKYFVQVRANLAQGNSAQSAPVAFTVVKRK